MRVLASRAGVQAAIVGAMVWLGLVGGSSSARAEDACASAPATRISVVCDRTSCSVSQPPKPGAVVELVRVVVPAGLTFSLLDGTTWAVAGEGRRVCQWTGEGQLATQPRRAVGPRTKSTESIESTKSTKSIESELSGMTTKVHLGLRIFREGDPGQSTSSDVVRDLFWDVVIVDTAAGAICSGVVVGAHDVLTARHCGAVKQVRLGARSYRVAARLEAPARADAALLRIAEKLPEVHRARSRKATDSPRDGRVHIVGYGADDAAGKQGIGVLREGDASANGWSCRGPRIAKWGCVPEAEVVVTAAGVDACNGDSGGPIFDLVEGSWRLIGLTSRRLPTAKTPCGGGGIYTHVGALASWLDAQIGKK